LTSHIHKSDEHNLGVPAPTRHHLMKKRPASALKFFRCFPFVISPRSYVIEQLLSRFKDRSMRVLPLGELDLEAKVSLQLQA
jgi:hypothetical protein